MKNFVENFEFIEKLNKLIFRFYKCKKETCRTGPLSYKENNNFEISIY